MAPISFLARLTAIIVIALTLTSTSHVEASPVPMDDAALRRELIVRRAMALLEHKRANPTGSYTPSTGACPVVNTGSSYTGFIRSTRAHTINANESAYIDRHRTATQQSWTDWLGSASPGPNLGGTAIAGGVQNYTSDASRLPRVAIALSGGGYRAMINGAGVLQGFDARNTTAQQRGTAGVLQRASYVAGLSGGSWAVGSLAMNNWPQAQELAQQVWNLNENLIIPSDNTLSFYADIVADVAGKRLAGYPTGIVDYWGRALSYHLLNSSYPDEGQGTTWGDVRNTSSFQQAAFPFPLISADEREPGQLLIYRNTTIFEFNPYEFGSFDNDVAAMVDIDVLGTTLVNGVSAQSGNTCTYGFDNFGYVVGTSSTLFNGLFNMLITSDGDSVIKDALQSILGAVSSDENDVSVLPNPFRGFSNSSSVTNLEHLTLVDGGEDDQNIPLASTLLTPARELDLILAVDNSADVTNWPNGTALYETFLRFQRQAQFNDVAMPIIPTANTFINRGLNTRPTLFGCNNTDADVINRATAANGTVAPIIAYIPNYPWSAFSNTSTFQLQYDAQTTQQSLDNAVDVATQGGKGDLSWPTCLACASLERGFVRSNTARPQVCTQCLQTYCWDGVTNDTAPAQAYSPAMGVPAFVSSKGTTQKAPAYTGGNGTNSGATTSASTSSSGTNAATSALRSSSSIAALLAALIATSFLAVV